jgi:hypothetical protein
MHTRLMSAILAAFLAGIAVLAPAAAPVDEPVDLHAVYRIKDEGLQRSQVMTLLSWLTDVHGPRLTNSPNIRAAATWATRTLEEWGLANVRLEKWGPFGPGWSSQRFVAHAVAPQTFPLIGYPKAWTPGTDGLVRAEAVMAIVEREEDFTALRGRLKGKFALTTAARDLPALFEAPGRRFTDADLEALARQPEPSPGATRPPGAPPDPELARKRLQFFLAEGVAATIEAGRGDGGTVFVGDGRLRAAREMPIPAQVVLAAEHYGRLVRLLDKKLPVVLEMDVQNEFDRTSLDAFNVLADLAGTDLADELVIIGAHFDSWHTGTGATDNAAGSAVMMEAMRILRAVGLPMRRTIRLALWTGEEQGLMGSRAHVAQHFADRATMTLKPGHAKVAAYFNVDNGTGAIRGVYLQRNEAVRPVFAAWMDPFRNMGMTTLAIRSTGGTDHLAFDEVGLPGFQFIQDPVEYSTRTHHSNMDVYERGQPADLMQNAVIVASFAYHAANRADTLPRKPLPPPTPAAPAPAAAVTAR